MSKYTLSNDQINQFLKSSSNMDRISKQFISELFNISDSEALDVIEQLVLSNILTTHFFIKDGDLKSEIKDHIYELPDEFNGKPVDLEKMFVIFKRSK